MTERLTESCVVQATQRRLLWAQLAERVEQTVLSQSEDASSAEFSLKLGRKRLTFLGGENSLALPLGTFLCLLSWREGTLLR